MKPEPIGASLFAWGGARRSAAQAESRGLKSGSS